METLNAKSPTEAENSNFIVLDRSKPIRSDILFSRVDEVLIAHQGEQYRLRRTRNGKLILTK
jgi:hemin uptake protein HemP